MIVRVNVACENIRFSSFFVAEDVPRETSSATKSEEKRMFSQARVNVALNRTVVVDGDYNNNSPIQDYVHPDDHNQPI